MRKMKLEPHLLRPLSLKEIVRRAQDSPSERDALLGELYVHYQHRAYLCCLRIVKNSAEAEDLVQDAFIRLKEKLPQFAGESDFFTWFYRLVTNVALAYLRDHRSKARIVPLAEPFQEQENVGGRSDEERYVTEDAHLAWTPERTALQQEVEKLPLGYRTVFVLYAVYGFKHREIAAMLGFSVGNSKAQYFRARRQLRRRLSRKLRRPAA